MQMGIFTNGAYDVLGVIVDHQLKGIIIKTKYPAQYRKFQFVFFPEYHYGFSIWSDEKPQFVKRVKE